MSTGCPDLEVLDRHSATPGQSDPSIRDHIASCEVCHQRLTELSRNQALFAELDQASNALLESLPPVAEPPQSVGEYEIIREIGRGGMGVVYEAVQRRPERRVALKVLRREYAASEDRIRLFEREIRVLARLKHPGITAIHESSASADGPFYVMEFVQGVPLGEYVRRFRSSLDDRLRLFLRICAAIGYAHQHGVIHRDLKPGNILVEKDGSPKVLDFGLARITDTDITMASIAMDTGRIVGTLAYMSPEQTRGDSDEIDVRSDLYSLGVILYEMLTGVLPYDVPRNSVPMAVKSICESPPIRPSSAAKSREDARVLGGDLETIVLKSIEKLPADRYQSVAAFAEDIERFLTNQPIVARPPSAIYQFRKFAQRNRVLVGSVIAIFLALATGMITTGWQWYRARAAEHVALEEAATNAEINKFLATMFSAVDPAVEGPDVRVVQILKKSAGEIDAAFAGRPRVALALKSAIGRAYESLTLYEEAEPLFRDALKLAATQLRSDDRETLSLRFGLGVAMAQNNQVDAAYPDLVRLADDQARVLGPDDPDTLSTRHFIAVLATDYGRLEEGERIFRDVLARQSRTLGPEDKATLQTMSDVAIVLGRSGKHEESDAMAHKVYETANRVLGPDSPQTILYAGYVTMTARTPEEYEAVEPLFRDLVERTTRVYGPTHQVTLSFIENLAQLLELRCKFVESEAVARDFLRRKVEAYGEDDPRTFGAIKRLAHVLVLEEKYEEPERLIRRYLSLIEKAHGKESNEAAGAVYELVPILDGLGKLPEAIELAEHALAIKISQEGDDSFGVALSRIQMSDILNKLGRAEEGRVASKAGLDALNAMGGVDPILIGWAERNLGINLRDLRRFDEAEPLISGALDKLIRGLGECHPYCDETKEHLRRLHEMRDAARRAAGPANSSEWAGEPVRDHASATQ